jgi:SAM-dependent methyltransferase
VALGDAGQRPVASGSVWSVAALWMLYHLDEPATAIAEAHRVLRPGGLFVASASRRDDSPELCPPSAPTTFDAEEAPSIVQRVFGEVEVEGWDAPLVELHDRDEVRRYLVQQMGDPRRADDVEVPITVTKRGCLVWARKT